MLYKTIVLTLIALPMYSSANPTLFFPQPDPPVARQTEILKKDFSTRALQHPGTPTLEWLYHKTSDDQHPNGEEQAQLWLLNRARQNPTAEGHWLATTTEADIANGRTFFNVDLNLLKKEFSDYPIKPPAAFDVRLYRAAKSHTEDMIARNAQDHDRQFDRVRTEEFQFTQARGNVFSYAENALNAHAGYNIDWGPHPDGMQPHRGHRQAIQSLDANYTNVGIAAIPENNPATEIGPWVTTGNFAHAQNSAPDHFNRFLVGTVWEDQNKNGRYDPGEGIAGVTVLPDHGAYFSVTSASGGYAIPMLESGAYQINFSGGHLNQDFNTEIAISDTSILLDYKKNPLNPPSSQSPTPVLQFDQPGVGDTASTIVLDNRLHSPVVILGPPGYRGHQPTVASILNITDDQFEFKAQEWNYLDQHHLKEKISYLVLNSGQNRMPDGSIWELGTFPVQGTAQWHPVNFMTQSNQQPYLFLTLQTHRDGQLVILRSKNVNNTGFSAAMFEQESLMNGHAPETGGYLAIFPDQNSGQFPLQGGANISYSLHRLPIQDHFTAVPGGHLKLEEETSKDTETRHIPEIVDILRLNGHSFAQITSFHGSNTVSLRKLTTQ